MDIALAAAAAGIGIGTLLIGAVIAWTWDVPTRVVAATRPGTAAPLRWERCSTGFLVAFAMNEQT